jgi:hypothetical protein
VRETGDDVSNGSHDQGDDGDGLHDVLDGMRRLIAVRHDHVDVEANELPRELASGFRSICSPPVLYAEVLSIHPPALSEALSEAVEVGIGRPGSRWRTHRQNADLSCWL